MGLQPDHIRAASNTDLISLAIEAAVGELELKWSRSGDDVAVVELAGLSALDIDREADSASLLAVDRDAKLQFRLWLRPLPRLYLGADSATVHRGD